MELTRRDALAALASAGVAVGGGAAVLARDEPGVHGGDSDTEGHSETDEPEDSGRPLAAATVDTLVAAAEVLYPSEVSGVESFVREFAQRRAAARPDHAAGVADAVAYLDDYTESWHGEPFAALDAETRGAVFDDMDLGGADADPEGEDVELVRYYVRNDLLFALYASPTGGELVGLENPQGHPGGTVSYQRGPQS